MVFVFAVTQVTHYAAHHLDVSGILRTVAVFWLIWWAWSQFTWALNAANTDHQHVRVVTLVSTGVAFAMAFSVENAFSAAPRDAAWFSLSYVAVRLLGLSLYYRVARDSSDQRMAVRAFAGLSISGLVAVVVGGLLDPDLRIWLWLTAIALDLTAAGLVGNRRGWGVHPGHFAERHGLIVIIALGESLIVAGSALTAGVSTEILATGAVAVLLTCLLWWTYFGWIRELLEEKLAELTDQERARFGRDAYSFLHFPLVSGIVALAIGFEGAFHPDEYSLGEIAGAIGVGLALFLTATAAALWRAVRCVLWNRLAVLLVTLGALTFSPGLAPLQILGVACIGLMLIVAIEQITVRKHLMSS